MTRIPYAETASLSEATQRALTRVPPLNIFRLLAGTEESYIGFMRFTGALWNDAELSPRRRELAVLEIARLADSPYEWHQHVAVALQCDVTQAEIDAIEAADHGRFDADDRALLEMTGVIVRRERATDALLAATRAALGDRQLLELHLVVAVYAGLAAIMTNLDLDLDDQLGVELLRRDARGPLLGD